MIGMRIDSSKLQQQCAQAVATYRAKIQKGARDLGEGSKDSVEEKTPKDTGETAATWELFLDFAHGITGTRFVVESTGDQAVQDIIRWLEFGTGIYGPRGKMIVPVHAKMLRWVDRVTGKVIFAKQVKGIRPFRMVSRTEIELEEKSKELARTVNRAVGRIFK